MNQQTSILAYTDNVQEKARLRQLVYAVIMNDGPLSDAEIGFRLNVPRQTVAPRRNELVRMGWVKKSGVGEFRGRTVNLWGMV